LEYKTNYIESLRTELVELVRQHLTPIALEYGFSEVPLETSIKWRPVVLILGNYSSGKSTLINELLGAEIQSTGQAPTDDSFTVITNTDEPTLGEPRVVEERDGKVLLNDPRYPFASLSKHGQRFASHFRLKKVNSPFLDDLALIDTPGMLDSISERDRGYDYQDVIGDFAQIADLVLVLFDPHKAGTVREAYTSLRDTLPAKTFEDRVLFVLNRVDECASLIDLLRVYGTLCWNLSQMTGRKDIPMIRLTYSEEANKARVGSVSDKDFLSHLHNQRNDLKQAILEAPKHRLDHLATFVETHGEKLTHFLEALIAYKKAAHRSMLKFAFSGMGVSIAVGLGAYLYLASQAETQGMFDFPQPIQIAVACGALVVFFGCWFALFAGVSHRMFHRRQLQELDRLTPLNTQSRRDIWADILPKLREKLELSRGKFQTKVVKQQYKSAMRVYKKGSKEIREALAELGTIRPPDGSA
jgi:energy-coupling factor transporter ATP-binding protein EcfA2